jgi:hypothetical protein
MMPGKRFFLSSLALLNVFLAAFLPVSPAYGLGRIPSATLSSDGICGIRTSHTHHNNRPTSDDTGAFTIAVLPDTQFYSASYPDTFTAQTRWIRDNRASRNIVFVTHEGDIVDNNANWNNANISMSILDGQVPYGMAPGNNDSAPGGTGNFNTYFPYTRYAEQGWYGGHYGSDNDNSYQLFSAGGQDFIILHIEFGADSNVLLWADGVLKSNPGRKAILTSHYLLNGDGRFGADGSNIYNALKGNNNLFLMLCGHVSGESRRADTYNGCTVHTVLADYQGRANGGDGWLRLLQFNPTAATISVMTYSPTLNQYETDTDSQFQMTYGTSVPPSPDLTSPAHGATTTGTSFTFQWAAASGATNYYLSVVKASDNSIVISQPIGNVTTYTQGGFPNNGTVYRWAVCAGNIGGWSAPSTRSFTSGVSSVPPSPSLSSPGSGASASGTSINFQWVASAGATTYYLSIVRASDNSIVISQPIGNVTNYTQGGFPNNGTVYRWAVCAGNSSGWSAPSTRSFTSGTSSVPPAPSLSSPGNGAVAAGTSINFQWGASSGATNYYLSVVRHSDNSIVISQPVGNVTSYTVGGFLNNGTVYRWAVCAGNSLGWSAPSATLTFTNGP